MSLAKPAEAGAAARFASLNIGQNIERLQARPVSVLFGMRDKQVSAARACAKMHIPANGQLANGQSGRRSSCPIRKSIQTFDLYKQMYTLLSRI